jgi:hypothetical protein
MKKATTLKAASVSFPSGYDVKDLNLADQGNLRVEWATQDWQPASM